MLIAHEGSLDTFNDAFPIEDYIEELQKIGWNYFVFSPDLISVTLMHTNEYGFSVFAVVDLLAFRITDHNMPEFRPQCTSLSSIYLELRKSSHLFLPLWSMLVEIDSLLVILSTINKDDLKSMNREIMIDFGVSAVLTFDPFNPTQKIPKISIISTDDISGTWKRQLLQSSNLWNPEASIILNLDTIFSKKLPRKGESILECGVCLEVIVVDGNTSLIPNVACPNRESCQQVYHSVCLQRWFNTQTSTKRTFNSMANTCIYCKNGIITLYFSKKSRK